MSDFYTIISGTNRVGSNTIKIAQHYKDLLEARGIDTRLVTLEGWKSIDKTRSVNPFQKVHFCGSGI
jgi:hypothetical protein